MGTQIKIREWWAHVNNCCLCPIILFIYVHTLCIANTHTHTHTPRHRIGASVARNFCRDLYFRLLVCCEEMHFNGVVFTFQTQIEYIARSVNNPHRPVRPIRNHSTQDFRYKNWFTFWSKHQQSAGHSIINGKNQSLAPSLYELCRWSGWYLFRINCWILSHIIIVYETCFLILTQFNFGQKPQLIRQFPSRRFFCLKCKHKCTKKCPNR